MRLALTSVLLCGLLLAGCSLYRPTRVSLPVEPPGRYVEDSGAVAAAPVLDRWWQIFHDPQLDRLMERLFTGNLQLEQAFARLEQARAATRIAGGARWPSLGLGGQGSREKVPGFVQNAVVYNYRFSAQSSFEFDFWSKQKDRQRSAMQLAAASRSELQTLYLSLSAQLADLYYFVAEQRAQLRLAEETVASCRETLKLVERRYRQGLVPAAELYQARQSLAAAEAGRSTFARNLATAEHGIAVLLGDYPGRGVSGNLAELPAFREQFPTGLPADLLQRRPDIAARFHQLRSADAELAAAIADRLPTLNLAANYGFLQTDFGIGVITGNFWQLLIQPALPLLDGGRRRAEVARNRAVVRERLAGYRQAVLDAYREVEDALADNHSDEQRIERLAAMVDATAANLRLARKNYLYGIDDYLQVLSAQRNALQARSELLAARRQLISDRISLARALGGTWMDREISRRFAASGENDNHE
ncbi:NodT family efflux transporter outer membrane factor (OMF) lipoprotein [Geothermobacter ehrlichii]|uniref:NodT family efflux transporter outer membrane factor (OMF) lipoprotein n=1 Tax=Geothermobacter ehrlichii TaxID=213224 RepID=A0A5D3WL19_9BACT|nr:efflux transporter outer membrane subunit [Geothermobacter ehrlichii]TYO99092.1 NodT family efflux transporter outer membrane factor (OMF) lipoprotein [Geothermobacter ehrlichii]